MRSRFCVQFYGFWFCFLLIHFNAADCFSRSAFMYVEWNLNGSNFRCCCCWTVSRTQFKIDRFLEIENFLISTEIHRALHYITEITKYFRGIFQTLFLFYFLLNSNLCFCFRVMMIFAVSNYHFHNNIYNILLCCVLYFARLLQPTQNSLFLIWIARRWLFQTKSMCIFSHFNLFI